MSLGAFIGVALVHFMAAVSPGPSFVLSVKTAAAEGFRSAAGIALGFGIGAAIWASTALAGLTVLFDLFPFAFVALKLLGGMFLVYLAILLWLRAPYPLPHRKHAFAPRCLRAAIRMGVVTMMANPKPAIFFGAVFVGLVPVHADATDKTVIVANVLWVEAGWYVLVAWVFSRPGPRAVYARAKTGLDRAFGGLLGALGAKVALS